MMRKNSGFSTDLISAKAAFAHKPLRVIVAEAWVSIYLSVSVELGAAYGVCAMTLDTKFFRTVADNISVPSVGAGTLSAFEIFSICKRCAFCTSCSLKTLCA